MGSWGPGVMQSDGAVDMLCDIFDTVASAANVSCENWTLASFPNDGQMRDEFLNAFELARRDLAADLTRKNYRVRTYEGHLCIDEVSHATCVLTICLMAAGASLDQPLYKGSKTLRQKAIAAAKSLEGINLRYDCTDDAEAYKQFAETVATYAGTPAYVGGNGLFDTIYAGLAERAETEKNEQPPEPQLKITLAGKEPRRFVEIEHRR